METKHTKGEWKVIKNGLNGKFSPPRKLFLINSLNKESVNHVTNIATITMQMDAIDEQAEANAKLIAAAPELLEALDRLNKASKRYEQERDSDSLGCLMVEQMFSEEVIKKATE